MYSADIIICYVRCVTLKWLNYEVHVYSVSRTFRFTDWHFQNVQFLAYSSPYYRLCHSLIFFLYRLWKRHSFSPIKKCVYAATLSRLSALSSKMEKVEQKIAYIILILITSLTGHGESFQLM